MFFTYKWQYISVVAVRLINMCVDIVGTFAYLEFITQLEIEGTFNLEQMYYPIMMGTLKVLLDLFQHYFWGYFDYQMIFQGTMAQASLKTILYKKSFRMSEATNKDFSSGEINSIIMHETGIVWKFVWDMSNFIEVPI